MEYRAARGAGGRLLNSRGVKRVLERRAHDYAPRIAAATRVASGETKGSTRVEPNHRSASGDRPAVRIVQDGAVLPENFRQNRDYMMRALGGGG